MTDRTEGKETDGIGNGTKRMNNRRHVRRENPVDSPSNSDDVSVLDLIVPLV
jgi:hypothetical protein